MLNWQKFMRGYIGYSLGFSMRYSATSCHTRRVLRAVQSELKTRIFKRNVSCVGLILASSLCSTQAYSQDASDIWVGKLNLWEKQPITELVQITNNEEYSNQPYFFDNNRLFYTQALEVSKDKYQMDSYVFDFQSGIASNITQSDNSEYSPTPVPKTNDMSVISVDEDGKQTLWQIDPLGKYVKHLAQSIEPVGYQTWINDEEMLLFVLGEPNTLQRVNATVEGATGKIIDREIGASLHRFERSDWYLYTTTTDGNFLNAYNEKTDKIIQVTNMPQNSEYFSISRMGNIITSDGKTLWQRKLMVKGDKIRPLDSWQEIKLKHAQCSSGVTRTAISPDTSMIALVCPRL